MLTADLAVCQPGRGQLRDLTLLPFGFAAYRKTAALIVLTHTEVDPSLVRAWMARHPEYDDLDRRRS